MEYPSIKDKRVVVGLQGPKGVIPVRHLTNAYSCHSTILSSGSFPIFDGLSEASDRRGFSFRRSKYIRRRTIGLIDEYDGVLTGDDTSYYQGNRERCSPNEVLVLIQSINELPENSG